MSEKLFVFGNISEPFFMKEISEKVFEEGSLKGYRKSSVKIKGDFFPILEKSGSRFDFVLGKVFEVSQELLRKLDFYCKDECKRIKIVLSSGEDVWAYI